MGVSVAGGSVGVPYLVGAIGVQISLSDTGASPSSRVWSISIKPPQLSAPPTITNPTSANASFTPPDDGDGLYKIALTRLEHDNSTSVQSVVVGVQNIDGVMLPSPGITDQDFSALGNQAVKAGWAGDVASPQGNHFANAYIRRAMLLAQGGGASSFPHLQVDQLSQTRLRPTVGATTTVDGNVSNDHEIVLTQDTNIADVGLIVGSSINLRVVQDSIGGWNGVWSSAVVWGASGPPQTSTSAHAVDEFTFTCSDISGAVKLYPRAVSIADVYPVVPYVTPFQINGWHKLAIWDGAATLAGLVQQAFGHAEGSTFTFYFPANTATGLTVDPDMNIGVDVDPTTLQVSSWDATKAHIVTVVRQHGATHGYFKEISTPDVTAPTITGITCSGDSPSRLACTFTEPVNFPLGVVAGLSLTGTGVGGRTISGTIVSGNNTSVVTLAVIGGDFVGTETPSLVVGSGRTYTDLSGNLGSTQTKSVDMAFVNGPDGAYPWDHFWGATGKGVVSGNLTSWEDSIGHVQLLPDSTGRPHIEVDGGVTFDADATKIFSATVSTPGTVFAMAMKFKNDTGTFSQGVGWSTKTGAHVFIQGCVRQNQQLADAYDGVTRTNPESDITTSGYHYVFIWGDHTNLHVCCDNNAIASAACTGTFADDHFQIGGLTYSGGLCTGVAGPSLTNGTLEWVGIKVGGSFDSTSMSAIMSA